VEDVLRVCQYITVIGGALIIVWRAVKFMSKIEDEINDINRKLDNDNKRIEELQTSTKHICTMLVRVADHMITGNHVDKMKETRDEILEYISEV